MTKKSKLLTLEIYVETAENKWVEKRNELNNFVNTRRKKKKNK